MNEAIFSEIFVHPKFDPFVTKKLQKLEDALIDQMLTLHNKFSRLALEDPVL